MQAPMVAVAEGDPAVVVATLRQALDALTRLSAERAALEEALKVPCRPAPLTPSCLPAADLLADSRMGCFPCFVAYECKHTAALVAWVRIKGGDTKL